jgi:endoglucanase
MKELIKKLVETYAPSGYEAPIREVVRAEIEAHADEIRVDPLGSLIARVGSGGPKIMLAAHMDEIGLIVTHIDENGFARFTSVGALFPITLPGSRVRFLNGASGVIGTDFPKKATDVKNTPSADRIFLDLGATSRSDCPVQVGDVAAFERPFLDLGDRMVAKSFDDRAGVAVLIETMRTLASTPNEIYFVFSVQEEVNVRGATAAAYSVDPEIGLAVDVTPCNDTPKGRKRLMNLGGGPAVKVRDQSMLSDPRIVSWMVERAKEKKILHQIEILEIGSTDARAIQISRAGVLTGGIGIPARYVHTPSEMVDRRDLENSVRLLRALLEAPAAFPSE